MLDTDGESSQLPSLCPRTPDPKSFSSLILSLLSGFPPPQAPTPQSLAHKAEKGLSLLAINQPLGLPHHSTVSLLKILEIKNTEVPLYYTINSWCTTIVLAIFVALNLFFLLSSVTGSAQFRTELRRDEGPGDS